MRTLTNNELHRLRHVVAEQANDAQRDGVDVYLRLGYHDTQDVADALEELVALRAQEEDAANAAREKRAIVEVRTQGIEFGIEALQEALSKLDTAVFNLREAVEG